MERRKKRNDESKIMEISERQYMYFNVWVPIQSNGKFFGGQDPRYRLPASLFLSLSLTLVWMFAHSRVSDADKL